MLIVRSISTTHQLLKSPKMLIRQLGRGLRSAFLMEKRCFSVKTESQVDERQAEALDKDLCLLVDEKDNFMGTATKRYCHSVAPDGSVPLHRAFSVFLFNKRGDMLLQRRSSNKVTFPDYYTNACCSHPLFLDSKQEDVVSAARRRMHHELGIPLEQMDPNLFKFMTKIHYHDEGDGVFGEHEIDHILIFQNDVKLTPNSEEVSEIAFIPKEEFNAFIPTLEGPLTPWFRMIKRYRLKLWWDNLHRLDELKDEKIHELKLD